MRSSRDRTPPRDSAVTGEPTLQIPPRNALPTPAEDVDRQLARVAGGSQALDIDPESASGLG